MSVRLALLSLSLALSGWSCRPGGDRGGRIDVQSVAMELGTGGLTHPDRWNRVLVSAVAADGLFQGHVRVSGRTDLGQNSLETFRREFAASKERQASELMVRPRGWDEMEVSFRSRGWNGSGRQKLDWSRKSEFRILGIAEARYTARSLLPAVEAWEDLEGRVAFGAITPDDLPAHFLGYEVADLVVLERTALARADPARIAALREWVERGGVIAAVPGPDWTGLLPEPLKEVFGLSAAPQPSAGAGEEGETYAVEPAAGAKLISDGLLLENRFGSGLAFLHTFAPRGALLRGTPEGLFSPEESRLAWKEVVRRCRSHPRVSGAALTRVQPAAVQALRFFSGFRYPPRKAVLLFALGYLGIGFFAAGIYFRRRKKLERMYLWALALAILSCFGIYRFGLLSAVTGQSLDEVTVATVRAGSSIADAASFLGVASADHRTVEPRMQGPAGAQSVPSQPVMEMDFADHPAGLPTPALGQLPLDYRLSGPAVELTGLRLYPNATRYVRYDYPLELGGRLEATVGEGELLIASNSTPHTLELSLVEGDRIRRLGPLSAGERLERPVSDFGSVPIPPADDQSQGNMVFNRYYGQDWRTSDRENLNAFTQALEQSLRGSRCLIARTTPSLFPGAGLGPVRHSMTFLILALPGGPDAR